MNLFDTNRTSRPRWASYENPDALPGQGGKTNLGAKGHPADIINPGVTETLMHTNGSGVVRRIWMTVDHRSPLFLRRVILRMYWDGAEKPAVECPLADFFGFGLARMSAFQSELFSSPEGRSLNCFIPMPFLTGAKITLTNENDAPFGLFYDVDYTLEPLKAGEFLYFHAYWNRENPTTLCKDYTVLPTVTGHGRYLGTSIGVQADVHSYGICWFGEGEMKFYLDGDTEYPTLCGTGTEDYIGDAWGQAPFINMTQGCHEGNPETGRYSFYRWHTVDPIYFQSSVRATIQCIGNFGMTEYVKAIQQSGAPMIVTTVGGKGVYDPDNPMIITDEPDNLGFNFYRQDDYCSTAYFYLDAPANALPCLADTAARTAAVNP